MQPAFEVTSAKRPQSDEDAPQSAPMAPRGGERLSPSSDQLKARRQQAKNHKTATNTSSFNPGDRVIDSHDGKVHKVVKVDANVVWIEMDNGNPFPVRPGDIKLAKESHKTAGWRWSPQPPVDNLVCPTCLEGDRLSYPGDEYSDLVYCPMCDHLGDIDDWSDEQREREAKEADDDDDDDHTGSRRTSSTSWQPEGDPHAQAIDSAVQHLKSLSPAEQATYMAEQMARAERGHDIRAVPFLNEVRDLAGVAASRHTAATDPPNIATARAILSGEHSIFDKVDGMIFDAFTASMVVQVYDALSDENKAKFGNLPLLKMVDVGWKLTKGSSRKQDTPTKEAKMQPTADMSERTFPCSRCGATVSSWGGMDTECDRCHALYNAWGQLLVDDSGYSSGYDNYMASKKEATMDEGKLLARMAGATLAEQRKIATQIAELRAQRAAHVQAERDTDLGASLYADTYTPVVPHTAHTPATDWLGEDGDGDAITAQSSMAAAASKWYMSTTADLRAEPGEFKVQASGYASMLASAHAPYVEEAHDAFMRHATFLNRQAANDVRENNRGLANWSILLDGRAWTSIGSKEQTIEKANQIMDRAGASPAIVRVKDPDGQQWVWLMSPPAFGLPPEEHTYESFYGSTASRRTAATCSCAHNSDGSTTSMLCPLHAKEDPCATMAAVTGGRRRGSIVGGVCSACGWSAKATASRRHASDDDDFGYDSRCPACGEPMDYCQGHGEMGDPAGYAILEQHDSGDHSDCDPDGCDEAEGGTTASRRTAATYSVGDRVRHLTDGLVGTVKEVPPTVESDGPKQGYIVEWDNGALPADGWGMVIDERSIEKAGSRQPLSASPRVAGMTRQAAWEWTQDGNDYWKTTGPFGAATIEARAGGYQWNLVSPGGAVLGRGLESSLESAKSTVEYVNSGGHEAHRRTADGEGPDAPKSWTELAGTVEDGAEPQNLNDHHDLVPVDDDPFDTFGSYIAPENAKLAYNDDWKDDSKPIGEQFSCPKCHSTNVEQGVEDGGSKNTCKDCGYKQSHPGWDKKSKLAADDSGSTCSKCGDPIERDPEGEENRTWHHNSGDTHDHEAEPKGDSKESRKLAGNGACRGTTGTVWCTCPVLLDVDGYGTCICGHPADRHVEKSASASRRQAVTADGEGNGYTNFATYQAVVWKDNDYATYQATTGVTDPLKVRQIVMASYPSNESPINWAEVDWQNIVDSMKEDQAEINRYEGAHTAGDEGVWSRADINGQVGEALKAAGIDAHFGYTPEQGGRMMWTINGEKLTPGEAADKYLNGGFGGNFGGNGGRTSNRRTAVAPTHVVVSDQDGQVIAAGSDGVPFTAETAKAFADSRNAALKPESGWHYSVHGLTASGAAKVAAKLAADGQTCSTCGDKIAQDPEGEEPRTWHHDNGEKHDHEAKPGSDPKESRRRVAANEDQPCSKCGKPVGYLEVFPDVTGGNGISCLDCHAASPAGQYMPTAEELARMWGGGGRRGSRRTAADARTCKHCGEEIEKQDGVGWVETRSGDDGGTYDICQDAPTENDDEDGRHAPEGKTGSRRRTAGKSSNCVNGNHSDCSGKSCSCNCHPNDKNKKDYSGACADGDHDDCKMGSECACPHHKKSGSRRQAAAMLPVDPPVPCVFHQVSFQSGGDGPQGRVDEDLPGLLVARSADGGAGSVLCEDGVRRQNYMHNITMTGSRRTAMKAGDLCSYCEKGHVTAEGGNPLFGTPMPSYFACDWCWSTYATDGTRTGKMGSRRQAAGDIQHLSNDGQVTMCGQAITWPAPPPQPGAPGAAGPGSAGAPWCDPCMEADANWQDAFDNTASRKHAVAVTSDECLAGNHADCDWSEVCDCSCHKKQSSRRYADANTENEVQGEVRYKEPNQETMWPWVLAPKDVTTGTDAADVASVPTPGGEKGYPKPTAARRQSSGAEVVNQASLNAFRHRIQVRNNRGRS